MTAMSAVPAGQREQKLCLFFLLHPLLSYWKNKHVDEGQSFLHLCCRTKSPTKIQHKAGSRKGTQNSSFPAELLQ